MANPTELQREVERALIIRAKSNAELTALVPTESIAPDETPTGPHIQIASPRTLRLRSACVRGARASFDIHAFAGPRKLNGAVVETGKDHVARIGSTIETVYADNRLTLDSGAICKIEFSDMQLLPDDEPDAWHWVSQLNCRVLAE